MSYDFALFIPDYDVDGIAVGSRYLPENKHLMERYNMGDVSDQRHRLGRGPYASHSRNIPKRRSGEKLVKRVGGE